ncbi:proteasomal ATPase-associated factor 1 [Aplysia californica]|uniref:Proteasomal ATPase-associated factor 1 n=1 Tax=Aplysia californica TaxID=6500 RepID=A0ABM0JMH8_APLCA|nr:proteasomal ATPase-associated factor 1 [Aplysia californica]
MEIMATPSNRLILQSDWDSAVRERNGKAWVSFKSATPPSEYSEVCGHGRSPEGLPYLTTKDEQFSVSDITKKSVVIAYNGETASLSRKFVAPTITFSAIHNPNKQVTGLDTSSGGLGVSSDSEGNLRLWQTDTGEVRRKLEGHVGDVYTCRFFPSGIVVLSAGSDMMVKVWSVETGACAATMTGHKAAILDTAIVDRGRNVITTSRDGTAKLWDVGQQQCLTTFEELRGDVNCCSLGSPENSIDLGPANNALSDREVSTDGKMLLLGCENRSVQGFGLQSREQIFCLNCDSAVNACTFVSEVFAVCGTQEGRVYVLDLRNTSTPLTSWKESRGPVLSLLAHKGGFFVSTGDGSCFHVSDDWATSTELTGSDCDPLYKVCSDGTSIYTACRDGAIRRYSLTYL